MMSSAGKCPTPLGRTDGWTVRERRAQRCSLVRTRSSAGSHALLATRRLLPLTSVDSVALGVLREGGREGGRPAPQLRGELTRRPTGATHCASVRTEKKKKEEEEERNSWGRSSALAADDIT